MHNNTDFENMTTVKTVNIITGNKTRSVHLADTIASMDHLADYILKGDYKYLGFDVEYEMYMGNNVVRVLQFASETEAYIFHFIRDYWEIDRIMILPEKVKRLLTTDTFVKVGFDLYGDAKAVNYTFNAMLNGLLDLRRALKLLELGKIYNCKCESLADYTKCLLDYTLNKNQRLHDWGGGMSMAALDYAAKDAFSCYDIQNVLLGIFKKGLGVLDTKEPTTNIDRAIKIDTANRGAMVVPIPPVDNKIDIMEDLPHLKVFLLTIPLAHTRASIVNQIASSFGPWVTKYADITIRIKLAQKALDQLQGDDSFKRQLSPSINLNNEDTNKKVKAFLDEALPSKVLRSKAKIINQMLSSISDIVVADPKNRRHMANCIFDSLLSDGYLLESSNHLYYRN